MPIKHIRELKIEVTKMVISIHNQNVGMLIQDIEPQWNGQFDKSYKQMWIDIQDIENDKLMEMLEKENEKILTGSDGEHYDDGYNSLYGARGDENERQELTYRILGAMNCGNEIVENHFSGNMDKYGPVITNVGWKMVSLEWKDVDIDDYIE